MDKFTPEKRSQIMSKIRSRDTHFELSFLNILKKNIKKRFETNVPDIKGKPDIVFRKYKVCVFLDSDFWHGWQYPRWKHVLKTDFWVNKIEGNRRRDRRITAYLRRKGWTVLRFWEHRLENKPCAAIKAIEAALDK